MSTRSVRPEAVVEKKLVQWAVKRNIICLKLTPDGQRGWPDRMFVANGRVAFIEFKAAGEPLRELQKYRIDQLIVARVPVFWTHSYADAVSFLEEVLYG